MNFYVSDSKLIPSLNSGDIAVMRFSGSNGGAIISGPADGEETAGL